jgi:predicted patatin/cPLA2 family phospholipase
MVDGIPMLDGGIIDSIPVLRATSQGHPFNVVVMTRNKGFRSMERDVNIPSFIYKEYPHLREALSRRVEAYNEQLEMVECMERWGEILVIRPQRKMEVGRTCSDAAKLERLYEEGFREGEKFCQMYRL